MKGTSGAKATLGNVKMDVKVIGYDVPINSEDYVLPIGNNIDITIDSVALDSPNDVALMAGATLEISQGSELLIKKKLILYDAELNVRPDFTGLRRWWLVRLKLQITVDIMARQVSLLCQSPIPPIMVKLLANAKYLRFVTL